ncbi:hypothetical protein GCM10018954_042120 [Kutzneria kofuensis]
MALAGAGAGAEFEVDVGALLTAYATPPLVTSAITAAPVISAVLVLRVMTPLCAIRLNLA